MADLKDCIFICLGGERSSILFTTIQKETDWFNGGGEKEFFFPPYIMPLECQN